MYRQTNLSPADVSVYASFYAWLQPSHESRLQMITDRVVTYDDLCNIDREIAAQKREKAIAAIDTTPVVKSYLHEIVRERGSVTPEPVDYTEFFKRAIAAKHNAFGKAVPAYAPEPVKGRIKMFPAKALRIRYSQESYSDDSAVLIPFAGEGDLAAFARNVSTLVRRANSHTGFAGSGATFEASVHDGFVIVSCRSSISD